MQAGQFVIVIGAGILLMLVSLALDRIWAAVIPVREIYYLVRAPGVVLHECSHILGCLLTGAKIQNIVLFSKEGGLVTYSRPALPLLGDVIISTAPLFCIPLSLAGISWCFQAYLGCYAIPFPDTLLTAESVQLATEGIVGALWKNIVVLQNGWFILYLYLTISLVLSVAPSLQDLRNAAIGIGLLLAAGLVIIAGNVPYAGSALEVLCDILMTGFTLGLAFGLVALICSGPLILYYLYRRLA